MRRIRSLAQIRENPEGLFRSRPGPREGLPLRQKLLTQLFCTSVRLQERLELVLNYPGVISGGVPVVLNISGVFPCQQEHPEWGGKIRFGLELAAGLCSGGAQHSPGGGGRGGGG